jgi:hypothetical protein
MSVLKIHLTYQCTAACDHCRFGCTPRRGAVLDVQTAVNAARALRDSNDLEMVVILGGEPGLYPEETYALTSALCDLGLRVRIETNACWATDDEHAVGFLEPLFAAGASVMFSLDAFHEPHVPPERVGRAVRLSSKMGGEYNLESAYLLGPGSTHAIDLRTDALLAQWAGQSRVYRGPIFFVGRAASRLAPLVARGRGVPEAPCVAVPWWSNSEQATLELLILDPWGYLSKGCGVAIGNVHQTPVEQILGGYRPEAHPIIGRLIAQGPLALAREAVDRGLYAMRADYADRCHLCQEARAALRTVYPEWLVPDQHYLA